MTGHVTAVFAASMLAAVLLTGCSSSGPKRLDTATASVDETRAQLDAGTAQIDAVVASMRAFDTSLYLDKTFEQYDKELSKLEDIADKVRSRRAAMQSRMQDHIDQWGTELLEIQNEDVRQISSERKEQLATSLTQLGAALDDLKDEYTPFISNLRDIRLLLANDLTMRGVELARPMMSNAIVQADGVKASISAANTRLAEAIAEFRR